MQRNPAGYQPVGGQPTAGMLVMSKAERMNEGMNEAMNEGLKE